MTNGREAAGKLGWKWIILGTLIGSVLATFSYDLLARAITGRLVAASIVGICSFVVAGMIIAYTSPGSTVKESAIGGMLAGLLSAFFLPRLGHDLTLVYAVSIPVAGLLLGLLGGWVGEEFQGTIKDTSTGVQWGWVAAGIVTAFVFNNFLGFGAVAFSGLNMKLVLVAFSASFFLSGIIIGYKSPGSTILETALAGCGAGLLNFIVLYGLAGIRSPFKPFTTLMVKIGFGLFFCLAGGWVGEKLQESRKQPQAAS